MLVWWETSSYRQIKFPASSLSPCSIKLAPTEALNEQLQALEAGKGNLSGMDGTQGGAAESETSDDANQDHWFLSTRLFSSQIIWFVVGLIW